ncbi:MAG: DUF4326 domain-containing protein [Gammaproteobacteria bacterium]|nr:DUF4326 domain-containing protein [Gammaproteobacteria bacterium]
MILNKHLDQIPEDAIYIGRGSKWGNPFKIGVDGSRSQVIFLYEEWLKTQDELIDSIDELKDKSLVCFCKPKPCHGDILIKVQRMDFNDRKLWKENFFDRRNFFQGA